MVCWLMQQAANGDAPWCVEWITMVVHPEGLDLMMFLTGEKKLKTKVFMAKEHGLHRKGAWSYDEFHWWNSS